MSTIIICNKYVVHDVLPHIPLMFLNNCGVNDNLATILSKTAICWITQDSIPSYNGTLYLFLKVTHIIVSDLLVFYMHRKTLTDLPCLMYFTSSAYLLVFMCFLLALIPVRETNILIHVVYLTNGIRTNKSSNIHRYGVGTLTNNTADTRNIN